MTSDVTSRTTSVNDAKPETLRVEWPALVLGMPVRTLRAAQPGLGVKPLVARLRAEQPGLGAEARLVREALIAFHAEHYSANTMCLAVLGREGLRARRAVGEQLCCERRHADKAQRNERGAICCSSSGRS